MPFNNDIGIIKVKESFTGVEIMARLPPKSATLFGKNQMLYSKSFFHHIWFLDNDRWCVILGWGRTLGKNKLQKASTEVSNPIVSIM